MKSGKRGIALAAALLALVVIGMLVAGAFFAGVLEQRAGENGRRLHQAFSLAEAGIGRQAATWDAVALNTLPVYPAASVAIAERRMASGVYAGRVLRLNENLYLMDITAEDSLSGGAGGGARQRVGLIARLTPVELALGGSLTAKTGAQLQGNVRVDGGDHTPPSWTNCGPPDSARAGVVAGGPVTTAGGVSPGGTPPVVQDTAQAPLARYPELAPLATIRQPGGVFQTGPTLRGGVCDRADPTNWGDGKIPTAPCGSHFPIIHIQGNATLTGGQGQGILLIDGDLTLEGQYEFFGLVMVLGRLRASGAVDVRFWGGVVADRVELELPGVGSRVEVNYSKCVISSALRTTGRPVPLVSRGWGQLF